MLGRALPQRLLQVTKPQRGRRAALVTPVVRYGGDFILSSPRGASKKSSHSENVRGFFVCSILDEIFKSKRQETVFRPTEKRCEDKTTLLPPLRGLDKVNAYPYLTSGVDYRCPADRTYFFSLLSSASIIFISSARALLFFCFLGGAMVSLGSTAFSGIAGFSAALLKSVVSTV